MVEDLAVSPEHIKQVAERALVIERCILKRAWGLCYAVAAVVTGLSASELRSFVGIGKGSLENHLTKLAASGLIRIRSVRSWGGTHQVAEITERTERLQITA
jgi:hypothetical protein